ncbi:MAG: alpha-mannosidase [Phycisphaerales bacterium]
MRPDSEVFRPRFEMLCRSVLAPAIWTKQQPLQISQWTCSDRFAIEKARSAQASGQFQDIELPFAWGPVWSTRWFQLRGAITPQHEINPQDTGRRWRLRFDTGTEATVWNAVNDPVRGLDEHRDAFEVSDASRDGRTINVLIEAACNHPFGEQVFDWDSRERSDRWRSAAPGLVNRAEVVLFDETVWRLHTRMSFAADMLAELEPSSVRAQDLYASMRRAGDAIDDSDVSGSASTALNLLDQGLERMPGDSAPRLFCVAHAHIDTAWLWPISETRRKTVRSWSNTLELMEQESRLHFMCSQPQQYAWLEEDAPSVFERLKHQVSSGQWEPVGSMWIEPDALVPSGESLIRQVLYGTRYLQSRFPDTPPSGVLFLPDTFGFPACLPTVMAACDIHTFVTNKIHWNQSNTFPHTSFRWQGLDGSEVLAHNTPGGDYNATLTPKELDRAVKNIAGRDSAGLPGPPIALQPFGHGDGGGGPTFEMLERVRVSAYCDGMPRTEFGSVKQFVAELCKEDEQAGGLPVWSGQIDLELHRGTLTTHQWLKQANARAERGLRMAELLVYGGEPIDETAEGTYRRDFDIAWERTLLNQFHDILPGSSISEVYSDARDDHALISETIETILDRTTSQDGDLLVVNAASSERTAVVSIEGDLVAVHAQAFSALPAAVADPAPVVLQGGRISNGLVSFAVDECGRIGHLSAADGVDLASERPLNNLQLYRDRPMNWDAWDIDLDYERSLIWSNDKPAQVELVKQSPLRVELRTEFDIGGSPCSQLFRLDAGSPMVEVVTEINWQESHRLLRVESAPPIRSERVTVGTQFGYISRPTHRNTGWDRFAFEFACHKWMDLSEPGRGLAILSDAIYGRSALGNKMGMSLLRSPTHPDPSADRGANRLRYAFIPHNGDWAAADVDRHAECFGVPVQVQRLRTPVAPIVIHASPQTRVEIVAFKAAAAHPEQRVLRLVETRGSHDRLTIEFAQPVRSIRRVNAIEQPIDGTTESVGSSVTIDIKPFEIVTLLAD